MRSHPCAGRPANYLLPPAALSAASAAHEAHGATFRLPLMRAALAGELFLVEVSPGGRVPAETLDHREPSTVVCLHDDGTVPAPGPAAFPQARRLLAWSAFTLLHATGGLPWHYELAVDAARHLRRVLLIETGSTNEAAWRDLFDGERARRARAAMRSAAGLVLTVVPGGVHPVEASR